VIEHTGPYRDVSWFKRHAVVPQAPILIATSEDIGTARVRANHVDAFIDYFTEQEALKKAGVPL
jgi:hypothetical protein